MKIKEYTAEILKELESTLNAVDEEQTETLVQQICLANRIFVAGAGRSLLSIRGLAMRLMQTGYQSYVVGETVTPAIEKGDLFIIASGSGKTGALTVMAKKCREVGAALALITTNPDSPIGRLADYIVQIPAATPKGDGKQSTTIQPGASTFEQSILLLGDAVILYLTKDNTLEKNNELLMKRHANLE